MSVWLAQSSAFEPGERTVLLRYVPAAATAEQREAARQSALFIRGDMRLVWVSEADLATLQLQGKAVSYGDE